VHFRFRQQTQIKCFLHPLLQRVSQFSCFFLVFRMLCQISCFVRIFTQVEKLFHRFVLPEFCLCNIQFSSIMHFLPDTGCRCLEHVVNMFQIGAIRVEMPHVDESAIGTGANHVDAFVHSSSIPEKVLLLGPVILAGERYSLHACWRFQAGQTDYGWSEVDKRHKPVRHLANAIVGGRQFAEFGRHMQ